MLFGSFPSSNQQKERCYKKCFTNYYLNFRTGNEVTCEICNVIFEGLDDTLFNNEEQVRYRKNELSTRFEKYSFIRLPMHWKIYVKACLGSMRWVHLYFDKTNLLLRFAGASWKPVWRTSLRRLLRMGWTLQIFDCGILNEGKPIIENYENICNGNIGTQMRIFRQFEEKRNNHQSEM